MKSVSNDAILVGSYSLESLTTGMYENPLHCLREYVQNAYDSIRSARSNGLLAETEGLVSIAIGGSAARPVLTITDDGEGITADKAVGTLVSIGASQKRSTGNAGFRGIGRLAGTAYCTTLRFSTTARGEDTETVVEFDCGRMRGYLRPGAEVLEAKEVMRLCATFETRAAAVEKHNMQVEMIGLVGIGLEFVEIETLTPYLRQVCPTDYSDRFGFAQRIRTFCESVGSPLGAVEVETRFKRERNQILKGYDNASPTASGSSKIHDLELISSPDLGWHAWIGKSSFAGEITDDTVAGVRFRLKNIQIGGSEIIEDIASELTTGRTEGRLQRYAVGEIFISNPAVVPNARRDGFEDAPAWRDIRNDIKARVARRVITLVRAASTARKTLKTLQADISSLARQAADVHRNPEAIDRLVATADKIIVNLGADKLNSAHPNEVGELLATVKGIRDSLIEARATKPSKPAGEEEAPAEEPEAAKDAVPEDSPDEEESGHDESASEAEEEWPANELLAALIEVLKGELGDSEAQRLILLARENLAGS